MLALRFLCYRFHAGSCCPRWIFHECHLIFSARHHIAKQRNLNEILPRPVFNLCLAIGASAQKAELHYSVEDLRALVEIPAVPGYEQQVAAKIAERVKSISPHSKSLPTSKAT